MREDGRGGRGGGAADGDGGEEARAQEGVQEGEVQFGVGG